MPAVAGGIRKSASGTGDSPHEKKTKKDAGDDEKADVDVEQEEDEGDMKSMMKKMMSMMAGMEKDMKEVKNDVWCATAAAKQAKLTADMAQETAEQVRQGSGAEGCRHYKRELAREHQEEGCARHDRPIYEK